MPIGIQPKHPRRGTFYLATIALASLPRLEASIFVSEREESDLLLNRGQLFRGPEHGPIEVVVHGRSERSDASDFRSPLSERAIVLGTTQEDWYTSGLGERTPMGRHKIGGRPALFKYWELEEQLGQLLDAGFVQIIQLDVPGPEDDLVGGAWPFADGMFHLLGREPFGEEDWVYFWEN